MKKRWYLLMSVLALAVVLVSGCSVKNTESDKSALAEYPFTAGRYFWPKPEWALPEPVFGEVPRGNPETLRPLTDSEKDRVVAIALSTPEAADWLEEKPEYRAELMWYTPEDPAVQDSRMLNYGYHKALYEIHSELYWRPGKLTKATVWYPGVSIGFGVPQQHVVNVAVDLEEGKAVHVSSYQDTRRKSDLRWLTDEEKVKAIELALNTPEAKSRIEQGESYRLRLSWKAIWDGGYRVFPYETVEEGIPLYIKEPESETVYPNVTFYFGEPAEVIVSVAVDLKKEEVISSEDYPNLSHPDRFPPDMLEINGIPSQAEYLSGQQVEIDFSFHNIYNEPVLLPNPPEIWVLHHDLPGSTEDWIIRSYPSGTEQLIINEGETKTYKFIWDQKDDNGKLVTPGRYHIRVAERPKSKSGKEGLRPGGEFEVFIQYEQGAMKKTIELNQSQTVSGLPLKRDDSQFFTDLTITLKRVELSEKCAQFSALATIPEYAWKSSHDYYPMHWIGCADAEYTFNGITKDAGCADQTASQEGIWLMWGYVNPRDQVPKDAKELTFRILIRLDTWYDDSRAWYGPWEFTVPLE